MKKHEDNLPWYVNETLDDAERKQVETAVEKDADLQQEQRFLQTLRKTLQEEAQSSPGEFGLARLKRDIARQEPDTPAEPARRNGWKITAVAASLVVCLQAGIMLSMYSDMPRDDVYVPLSGAAHEGPVIQVTFRSDATEAQIRAALNAVNGTIVSGPGALGVYYIALSEQTSSETALQSLRGYSYVEQAIED